VTAGPSSYDDEQDATQKEMWVAFQKWLTSQGGPTITPPQWAEINEPIPFSDPAVFPIYVYGGHLVDDGGQGKIRCLCHDYPKAPFNPFWGIKNHPNELVGIEKFKAETHGDWILTYGTTKASDRLERIASILEAMADE